MSTDDSLKGKTLLFVGSGFPRKRFIFQRAKQLGVRIALVNREVNWASRYADELCIADTYSHADTLDKLEDFLKANPVDGVVTFWEDDVPLAAAICEKFKLPGNSREAALNARNKVRTRQALDAAGLQKYNPPFLPVRSSVELEKFTRKIGFPCVLKPAWGAQSEFVVRVNDWAEAKNAFEYLQSNVGPKFDPIYHYGTEILCEGLIEGAEVDMDILLQDGEMRFYAFTDNFPTREPFFVETGDAMPSRHEQEDLDRVLALARATCRALGLTQGALHLEAKIAADGPKLIEVNARMGGDYIHDWVKTVWGVDLIEESLRIASGLPSRPKKLPEPALHLVGQYLIPQSSGVISGMRQLHGEAENASSNGKVHDLTLLKEIGDAVLVPPEGFEAIGWVVGKGHTYAEAEENLHEAMKELKITIARFDSTSSIGKTRRNNRFASAQVARRRVLQSARFERLRGFDAKAPRNLHVGVLCNKFEESGSRSEELKSAGAKSEAAVHMDLTSVGLNIQKALEAKGHRVTFFDMNETPLPFDKIAEANVDIVFNVCERINNSSLLEPHAAAILDCLGIPYTGSNPLTLAMCIDKIKVKKILEYHEIPTPQFDYVFSADEETRDDLRYPLIVKPANTDNSIGITNDSVVTSPRQLKERIASIIKQFNRPVLIEEYVEGDEVDVSIMGNEAEVKVLPLSRSIFSDLPAGTWHIYPFQAKWSEDPTYEKIQVERPAKYSEKLTRLISEITLDTYNIFDCHDYARIEVRVDKSGNPYVLEVNPNPSINRGDCVPNCAALIGLSYEDFIEDILKAAIRRYQAKPPYFHLQSALAQL